MRDRPFSGNRSFCSFYITIIYQYLLSVKYYFLFILAIYKNIFRPKSIAIRSSRDFGRCHVPMQARNRFPLRVYSTPQGHIMYPLVAQFLFIAAENVPHEVRRRRMWYSRLCVWYTLFTGTLLFPRSWSASDSFLCSVLVHAISFLVSVHEKRHCAVTMPLFFVSARSVSLILALWVIFFVVSVSYSPWFPARLCAVISVSVQRNRRRRSSLASVCR